MLALFSFANYTGLREVVEYALAYEAAAFDDPTDTDSHISGADMVGYFANWRKMARLALSGMMASTTPSSDDSQRVLAVVQERLRDEISRGSNLQRALEAVLPLAEENVDDWKSGTEDGTYDRDAGALQRLADAQAAVDRARLLLASMQPDAISAAAVRMGLDLSKDARKDNFNDFLKRESEQVTEELPILAVIVQGGVVQAIVSDRPEDIQATVIVVDYDVQDDYGYVVYDIGEAPGPLSARPRLANISMETIAPSDIDLARIMADHHRDANDPNINPHAPSP